MHVSSKTNFVSLMMMTGAVFAEDLSDEDRDTFSRWSALPLGNWGAAHGQAYGLAYVNWLAEVGVDPDQASRLPEETRKTAELLKDEDIPPLDRPLTDEVRAVFR